MVPNAIKLHVIPVIWVLHIYWQSEDVSALLGRAWCMNWAPLMYLSCLHCSAAEKAFEVQECAQLIPKGHCQCPARCQPWPWPSSRHVLALFMPSFRAFNVYSMSFFFSSSGFLPGWKASNMSSLFYIRPIHFFIIKTYRRCIPHWEHPMDNISCNILPVNKTF